jgi:hypothetical protein
MKTLFTSIPVIYRTWLSVLLIAVTLIAAPAWASYTPPAPSAPSGPTANTGRRGGCLGEAEAELTTLAPRSHVGHTVSPRPTLAWFVPEEQPIPIEIFIYDITDANPRDLIYKTELTSTPGLMTFTLPVESPGLEVGHRYFWQVVLLCNPNRPSSALIATAEFDVISPSSEIEAQMHPLNRVIYDDLGTFYRQRSRLYADSGVWYDAIADALHPSVTDRSTAIALLDALAEYESSQELPHESLNAVIAALRVQN